MKITLRSAGGLLAISLLLHGVARAQNTATRNTVPLDSNYETAEAGVARDYVATSYAAEAQPGPAACDCGGRGLCDACQSCNDCDRCGRRPLSRLFERSCDLPWAMPCPAFGGYGYTGVDSFRGITNGTRPDNTGVVSAANFGGKLIDDYGIGWQLGGSYGVYDFAGKPAPDPQPATTMQQTFLTLGVFRRADADHRLSAGLVHDWMFTNNFGVFGNSPTLSQFRAQVAWAASAWNQIGVWGTVQDRTTSRATGAIGTPITYQAIDQVNVFWDHQYGAYGTTSRFSVGTPLGNRLDQTANGFPVGGFGGTLGQVILSTNWMAPITTRMSGYINAMYMAPSASAGTTAGGAVASAQEFWNISVGLAFSPRGNLRSKTIAGRTYMPYLPVANNSSFLVDSNKTE